MKKIFIAVVALAAAACSNVETVSLNREAIAFGDAFVNKQTRSAVDPSLTTETLKESTDGGFAVFATVTGDRTSRLFDNVKVRWNNEQNCYTYSGIQYWIPGATYNFAAIAPADVPCEEYNMVSYLDATNTIIIDKYINDHNELIYATYSTAIDANQSGYNTPVSFNFKHALAKAKFSFKNNYNANNTKIRVHDIWVRDALSDGRVVINNEGVNWERCSDDLFAANYGAATDDEATPEKEDVDNAFEAGITRESQYEMFFIPIKQNFNVHFKYDIVVNDITVKTFSVTRPIVAFKFESGKAYDFKAEINPGKPIEFTATVSDWTPAQ